ncbi:MAG TPA: filamentous hemagglutinin N-terminal domain-containing protein, partial [Rhodocyclaceae bacterium]
MRHRRLLVHFLALALAICAAKPGGANPVNPTVVAGSVGFATSGNTLTVTNSAGAIINWQGFSIAQGEVTHFVQENAASAVLNRVTGQDPSQILGQLQSNGKVFLINPNGILFGKDARIDVAGLVASTLNISNQDFQDGRHNFAGDGRNGVVNLGTISTPAGGNVYLVGGSVRNEGLISSPKGEIILAAGQSVRLIDTATPNVQVEIDAPAGEAINLGSLLAGGGTIDIHAATVNQRGIVNADALVRDDRGRIRLIASDTMTLGAGSATSAANNAGGDGGFIETSGARVHVEDGASVSTAAPRGHTGRWLIDPVDFNIAASGGDISGATLNALLASNSVVIQTATGSNSATSLYGNVGTNGDIFVNDTVSWSANKLTLSAYRNIYINQSMNGSGTASLALEYGQGAAAAGNTADYVIAAGAKVNLPAGNNFSTKLGSDGATNTYTVITSLGAAGSMTATDLQGINGGLSGLYVLGADIDATATAGWNAGSGFQPIGACCSLATAFTGTFAGLGHTITGLTINRPGTGYVGLFGYAGYVAFPSNAITRAYIRDVGLVGGSVSGNFYVGGLVGYLRTGSIVSNSYNTGAVSGAMAGTANTGGLVGGADGDIIDSYSTGNVSASAGNQVGGLAGSANGAITHSYSTGNVSGNNSVGGLAGSTSSATVISRSYSTGGVSGNSAVGGLVGYHMGTNIINSYSTGAVNGSIYVGGLVGYINGGAPIQNSYSTGAVTGTTDVGGLVGWNNGDSVSNSFWDTTTSGQPTIGAGFGYFGSSNGITGMSTADMKTQANFTSATTANGSANPNWDFAATWTMTDGATYPHLMAPTIPVALPSPPAAPPAPPAPP